MADPTISEITYNPYTASLAHITESATAVYVQPMHVLSQLSHVTGCMMNPWN